jgi:DNA-binding transcriptional LysR family regulator
MSRPDLNLLFTLDVLLTEGSVVGAARKLQLSPSATSRALARLRKVTGDPLLVRAGRNMVATPRALELSHSLRPFVAEARATLRPAEDLDLKRLERCFTLQNRDGFVENFGASLIGRLSKQAPGVKLRFVQKPDKDSKGLRDGSVDLETAVLGDSAGPELRVKALFRDQYLGAVRSGHPLVGHKVTASRYAHGRHILIGIRDSDRGPIEEALEVQGIKRDIVAAVGGFSEALALARSTDLIASVPEHYTKNMRVGMHSFPLPFPSVKITVSMLWHPRYDADLAHRWLRNCAHEVCSNLA